MGEIQLINDNVISLIYEKIDAEIPADIKEMLSSQKVRKGMIDKYGNNAFLDPKAFKFPVVNPKTGTFDCKLIYAAILRASINAGKGGSSLHGKEYYEKIKTTAKKLYDVHSCGEKLKIKIKLNKEEADVLLASDMFDITEEEEITILNKTSFLND